MDMETIVMLVVAASALIMAGVGLYIAGKPATIGGVLESTSDAISDIEIAAGAAKEYVLAAEQLWKTGRIEKGDRLDWVLDRLSDAFPAIPEETLRDSVEAAVTWLKMGMGE
jgi:hypothetical protein